MRVAFDRQIATVLALVFHELWRPLNMLMRSLDHSRWSESVLYVPTSAPESVILLSIAASA